MTNKKAVPALIKFMNTGELPPIEWNWIHIMQVCREALTTDREFVILPIEETQDFKPQRRRLIKEDRESPKGYIQRDPYARERYYPYAAARFDAEELIHYAAARFNDLSAADLERLAGGVLGETPEFPEG